MAQSFESVSRATFDEVMVPNYSPAAMIPVRGVGSRVWDQAGKEYIDFVAGIAVNSLGHSHPALVKALHDQGEKLWHVANVLTNEPALRLAKKLVDLTFADKVFFCNSGAEANEAALKLVRRYAFDHVGEHKHEIISTFGSFHGRTLFSVSVGGQAKYKEGFEPTPGGISHVEFNNLEALKAAMSDKTCAVILEPIQGEGGVYPATQEFLQGARDLCDQYGALLIFDEIQTGVGRTGAFYAYQKYGVVPDILTTAKALGGGFPIGAMLASDKVAASFVVGTHGSTFGGNPLACAVSEAAVDILSKPDVLAGVETRATTLVAAMADLGKRYGLFREIRNMGLLIGCELNDAFKNRAKEFVIAGFEEGVMMHVAGPNVLRLLPSLVMSEEDMAEGIRRIEKAIQTVVKAV